LRRDARADLFDRIYFLAADRIAREAAHETIIIDELLKNAASKSPSTEKTTKKIPRTS
jgi:hypothetical protein